MTKDHKERHNTGETVRDVVLGMSDGLTVPFALAAGLSGADASSRIVVVAGLAEVAAGAISMGLGGYLSARSEMETYESERKREQYEVLNVPDEESEEVCEIMREYGLTPQEYTPVVEALRKRPKAWVDFMMKFELGMEQPDPKRAMVSAVTIGGSYAVGGMVPLTPYFFFSQVRNALYVSIAVTLCALFIFGYVKGVFTGASVWKSAFTTMIVGAAASGAAFGIALLVGAE